MANHKTEIGLISPEEAMKLFQFATTESLDRVKSLYDYYRKKEGTDRDRLWDLMRLLSFCYDTGRVQGIREERARAKV